MDELVFEVTQEGDGGYFPNRHRAGRIRPEG
jgi:hypothetical protein